MVLLDFKYQKCINCKLLAVIYKLNNNEYFMCIHRSKAVDGPISSHGLLQQLIMPMRMEVRKTMLKMCWNIR